MLRSMSLRFSSDGAPGCMNVVSAFWISIESNSGLGAEKGLGSEEAEEGRVMLEVIEEGPVNIPKSVNSLLEVAGRVEIVIALLARDARLYSMTFLFARFSSSSVQVSNSPIAPTEARVV